MHIRYYEKARKNLPCFTVGGVCPEVLAGHFRGKPAVVSCIEPEVRGGLNPRLRKVYGDARKSL
jgi:hypothetical protein